MSWLLMDMGNSRCKAAVCANGKAQPNGKLPWLGRYSWDNQDFERQQWQSKLQQIDKDFADIEQIIISSVASDDTKARVSEFCQTMLELEPTFLNSQERYQSRSKTLINAYDEPLALGVDRWLAMIGAIEQTDKAFAVLDAGTAITLDLVDQNGQHLGGHIVPGAKLMQKALFGDTGKIAFGARLDARASSKEQWLGHNSLQAVELGSYQAALGYLSSCMQRLYSHYQISDIFVCGGDGALMMEQIILPQELTWHDCPDLVLEGLFYQYLA